MRPIVIWQIPFFFALLAREISPFSRLVRRVNWVVALVLVALVVFSPELQAQDQPQTWGDFQLQGSVTSGYRFADIHGRKQKFLELFNLQEGFRLMDLSLFGQPKEGAVSPFADRFSLTLSGLGGDPFPGGQLTVQKSNLYDLRVNFRQSYFYWDRNDDVLLPPGLHGLTTNHDLATVRRFGSINFLLHATKNLRFDFEYSRNSRDGVQFSTRTLDYFGAPSIWGSFARANPYYIEIPLNEAANRFAAGASYSWRDWNFHYRAGYQTFEQNWNGRNVVSPERSINVDEAATARELVNNISWSEFRRLKTPLSEFSYTGRVNPWLDVRGGYIFYRYRGPATLDSAFNGSARTTSATNIVPYSVSMSSRARISEPNHVIDQGLTARLKEWMNFHADYRYSRFSVDSQAHFHSLRDGTAAADGDDETEWRQGIHTVDLALEFTPLASLVFRPGIRYVKRDTEVLEDSVIDNVRTRRSKSVWPTASLYYRPVKTFSARADFQNIVNSSPYTRISPHVDRGSRVVLRYQPSEQLSIEDNLVVRDRKFQTTAFRNNIRSNAAAVSYAFNDHFSAFGGFAYDSYFATASITFLRGTPPLTVAWRDQTVNRVWQGGISARPFPHFGIDLSGNFVRTTGVGEISGEPPAFGPLTWPLVTGTVYYDFPKAGRLSIDLQRTYYLEEIVRGNDFQANLLTLRWTRGF
ncbi:MAG TPA: hypothetical protein VGQ81_07175 [Acidobacteriota bacterium]|jgi:hypothetical protein|nr:hypothetical protein [Acidobacteriota bacterium]